MLFAIACTGLGLATPVFAQLVSVDCSLIEEDLLHVGECVSGPDDQQKPEECPTPGICVLGFGSDTALMSELCDPDKTLIPNEPRAICSTWSTETIPVEHQCIALADPSLNLFMLSDVQGDPPNVPFPSDLTSDRDFDMRDLAEFMNGFDFVPKRVQSDARIVSVECCTAAEAFRDIGRGLSGPAETADSVAVESAGTCTIGFSSPVEAGDFLFDLCAPGPVIPPGPDETFCISWFDDNVGAVQSCNATFAAGVVFDADRDGDLDLEDFAEFQNTLDTP